MIVSLREALFCDQRVKIIVADCFGNERRDCGETLTNLQG